MKIVKKFKGIVRKIETARAKYEASELRRLKSKREKLEARAIRARLKLKEQARIKKAEKTIGKARGGGFFGGVTKPAKKTRKKPRRKKPKRRKTRRRKTVGYFDQQFLFD